MKTNFIIPSWSYWKEPTRAQPLTQMYLATILEEEGIETKITDLRDGPKDISKADIFFYTVASPDLKEVQGIVKDLRKKYPDSKHVAGGPHPSIFPFSTKGFDSIVIGRGEESIKEIVEDFPNLIEKYVIPPKKSYPFPKRHFLSENKIVQDSLFKTDDIRSTTAQFSFGCVFDCSFCANYNRKDGMRRNSLEQISDEIDYLKKEYGIEGLSLQDEIAIPLHNKEAKEFLEMMKTKDIKWRGQIRAMRDPYILGLAKESGLVELSFGLESINEYVLKLANKRIDIGDVTKTLEACKEHDIKTRLYLLNGLPGEKEGIVDETKAFITKYNPDLVLLSSFQPYPGCPIERNPEKYGIDWISTDYYKFNHLVCRFENSKDDVGNAVPYRFAHGKGLTRLEITSNLLELQSFLRGRGANK